MTGKRHIHLHLTIPIQPGSTVHFTIGDDGHITVASTNGEPRTSTAAASDSASSDGTLTGASLEAAIHRLGRSGRASPNARAVAEDLRSLGYHYIPAESTKGGSPENYLRAIDPPRGTTAVAYLTPTYLEFTPFALQRVPDLASLPGAEPRSTGVKFSYIKGTKPALDAAKRYMDQSRKAGG
jgi:hypothetical protein